jgi:hypothetical protein
MQGDTGVSSISDACMHAASDEESTIADKDAQANAM